MSPFIIVTPAELAPEWIPMTRDIIAEGRHEVRGAPCNDGFTIEVKLRTSDTWQPRGWLGGKVCFATEAERDNVLEQIRQPAPTP